MSNVEPHPHPLEKRDDAPDDAVTSPGQTLYIHRNLGTRARHRALFALLALGLLSFFPAISSPFVLDDYLHTAMVNGTFPGHRTPFELYDFVDDHERSAMIDRGILPWWSHPQLTIRFFRPLSSAMLWANHKLLGGHHVLQHLPSVAWWILAVLAAHRLFRKLFHDRAALIATAIFALAPCHAVPIAWLANYEALVTLGLGTLAFTSYLRFRDEGGARAAIVSTVLFSLAFLAGEYALCFGGYLLAYELFRRGDSLGKRARGVLPFALPAAGYLAVRFAGRYGTFGSGFYTDPLSDPLGYLRGAPWRFFSLLLDGWLTGDVETFGAASPKWLRVVVVLLGLALLVPVLRRVFSRLSDDDRRHAKILLVGSLLATIPLLAVSPSPRVLGIAAIGFTPIVALVLDDAWFAAGRDVKLPGRAALQLAALLLGFAHFVHGPVTAWLLGSQQRSEASAFAEHEKWLRTHIGEPSQANVVVMRGWAEMFFAPFGLDPQAHPPASWRILAQTGHVLVLRRDPRTLEIIGQPGKSLISTGPSNLFRSEDTPLRVGEKVRVPGMVATVLEVSSAGPRRVRYEFDRELESIDAVWLVEGVLGYTESAPPKKGFGLPLPP